MKRPTETLHNDSFSECESCGQTWEAANHRACAARHHDATGHLTVVHLDESVRYGVPAPMPGQTSIFDQEGQAA